MVIMMACAKKISGYAEGVSWLRQEMDKTAGKERGSGASTRHTIL
jgi:hypothetical protein